MDPLKFGSEETFARIGETLQGGDPGAYEKLFEAIDHDLKILTNKYAGRYGTLRPLPLSDREDIQQSIMTKMWSDIEKALKGEVIKGLPKFYRESWDKSEQQRNAWLIKVVKNKTKDFCRKIERDESRIQPRRNDPEYENDDGWLDKAPVPDLTKQLEDRDSFFNALRGVFQGGDAPDSLLAFVYNRVLGTLNSANGSPKTVAKDLKDMPLSEVYELMVEDLSHTLGHAIPDDILKPLKDKVDASPDKEFSLPPDVIRRRSSYILNKVKEKRLNEQ